MEYKMAHWLKLTGDNTSMIFTYSCLKLAAGAGGVAFVFQVDVDTCLQVGYSWVPWLEVGVCGKANLVCLMWFRAA